MLTVSIMIPIMLSIRRTIAITVVSATISVGTIVDIAAGQEAGHCKYQHK